LLSGGGFEDRCGARFIYKLPVRSYSGKANLGKEHTMENSEPGTVSHGADEGIIQEGAEGKPAPGSSSALPATTRELEDYLSLPGLRRAVELVRGFDRPVRLVSHHDSDGLCAAAIIIRMLRRLGKQFHLTIMKNPDKETIRQIRHHGLIIFTDIGLSFTDIIREMEDTCAIILDHHRTREEAKDEENIIEISARLLQLEGGRACCGSTLAFLFALAVDERNWELLPLALTGMIGDHQYIKIIGLNRAIVEAAGERDVVTMLDGRLNICGATLEEALLSSTEPFFRGISGREDKIDEYLTTIGWEKGKLLRKQSEEENRYLVNILTTELLRNGIMASTIEEQCVTKFYSEMEVDGRREMVDLKEFSGLVDSCGRRKDYPQGIALCLGDLSDLETAISHRNAVREKLMESLIYLEHGRMRKKKGIQYFTNPESSTSSPLSGIGMQYLFAQDKVTLVLSGSGEETHVSARCTREMIEEGLDLSTVMREAARAAGGQGGGHNIAAGASFPKGNVKVFLEAADRMVCEQLGG